MTDKEKYLLACKYAVRDKMEKGSYAYTVLETTDTEVQTTKWIDVPWKDVLNWLNQEYQKEIGNETDRKENTLSKRY